MKKSELTFIEGFSNQRGINAKKEGKKQMVFDWDKAAKIIKKFYFKHKDLIAEAGLQGDWNYTGGIIFEEGEPCYDSYTYLLSNWAIPTLILSWDDSEQEEIECYSYESRFDESSKWDDISLNILN